MSSAKVQSVEAIQGFADHLQSFRSELLKQLEALDLQIRRLSQWVHEDALSYWQQEQQTNARRLAEHLQQLSRCMSYVRKEEERPCTEEKKRVAKAKERAQLCESKIRVAQAAALHWESRVSKLMTKLQRCRDMAESDLQVAQSHLKKHLELLESYTLIRSGGLKQAESTGDSHNPLNLSSIVKDTQESQQPPPEQP